MDTKKLFENFYNKSHEEIKVLTKQFIDEELFITFPDIKNEISIVITGSTASGYQDEYSDIDLAIFFKKQEKLEKYKSLIVNKYRNENKVSKIAPIEFHGGNFKSFGELEKDLESWNKDWLLREIKDAIIIYDTDNDFLKLQQKYAWYPDEIYKEKMSWLFAEATFLIFDRYKVGTKRSDLYYTESIKLKTLKLFLVALIMLGKKYPKSEKHLQKDIENVNLSDISTVINNILIERESDKIFSLLCILRKEIENLLVDQRIIEIESDEYWLGFRSLHQVEIEN